MKIGAPKELFSGEKRVAITPDSAKHLQKLGYEVAIEAGAGYAARFSDEAYTEAGVLVLPNADALWQASDIVLKVRAPEPEEMDRIKDGQTLISFIWPAQNPDMLEALKAKNVTALAMDMVPRISRA
ncbi:MAG: NAD(P)(+) transhydrogenase (Re/Si-specific) subunit alpha, partial [Pseudomonadota bacterium]